MNNLFKGLKARGLIEPIMALIFILTIIISILVTDEVILSGLIGLTVLDFFYFLYVKKKYILVAFCFCLVALAGIYSFK